MAEIDSGIPRSDHFYEASISPRRPRAIGPKLFAGHGEFGRGVSLSSASEPAFQQFRRDVPAGEKDTQHQDPFGIDCESNADGTPVADDPQTRHDLDPLCAALWKSRQAKAMVANAGNEIPGDRRRRTAGYVVLELLEFGFRLGWKTMRYSIAYWAFACFAR